MSTSTVEPINFAGLATSTTSTIPGSSGSTCRGECTGYNLAFGDIEIFGSALADYLVTPVVNADHAAFNAINDAGGVYGGRLVLYDCNDGPLLQQLALPVIGSWGYSESEWSDPLVFPAAMARVHEAAAVAAWTVQTKHPGTYALLCGSDPEMQAACAGARRVFDAGGARLVDQVDVAANESDLSQPVLDLRRSAPQTVVYSLSNPAGLARFIADAAAQGYYPPEGMSGSGMATESLGALLGSWPVGRFWTTAPFQLWGSQFMSTMAMYAPGNHGIETSTAQAGYFAAKQLAAALRQTGSFRTRAALEYVLAEGTWYSDPDLGQHFLYATAGLPSRGAMKNTGQCSEYMYEYTSTNTIANRGQPVGLTPDPGQFTIHDPLNTDCTQ